MTNVRCEIDLNEDPWDEHPCLRCKYLNKPECPHTLDAMIQNIMKQWHGLRHLYTEKQYKNAQKATQKLLKKYKDLYYKNLNKNKGEK